MTAASMFGCWSMVGAEKRGEAAGQAACNRHFVDIHHPASEEGKSKHNLAHWKLHSRHPPTDLFTFISPLDSSPDSPCRLVLITNSMHGCVVIGISWHHCVTPPASPVSRFRASYINLSLAIIFRCDGHPSLRSSPSVTLAYGTQQ